MTLLVHTQPVLMWLPVLISLVILLGAIYYSPWKQLIAKSIRLHLFVGFTLSLGLFWNWVGVNVYDIYAIHPLLITTAVFLFGLPLSLVLGAGALLVMHGIGGIYWENIGFHYLGSVVTPAMVTGGVLWLIARIHVQNLFIYTLGGSFFGSMLAVIATGIVCLLMLWLSQSTLLWTTWDNAYLFLMLTFPEGFCNGAIISTLTVLRPDLVKTYDDRFYLDGQ